MTNWPHTAYFLIDCIKIKIEVWLTKLYARLTHSFNFARKWMTIHQNRVPIHQNRVPVFYIVVLIFLNRLHMLRSLVNLPLNRITFLIVHSISRENEWLVYETKCVYREIQGDPEKLVPNILTFQNIVKNRGRVWLE